VPYSITSQSDKLWLTRTYKHMTKTDQIALPAMGLLVAPTSAAGSAEPTLIGVVGDKNRFRFLEFLAARIKNPNRHWGIVQILGR
jgi:hypothetical protein